MCDLKQLHAYSVGVVVKPHFYPYLVNQISVLKIKKPCIKATCKSSPKQRYGNNPSTCAALPKIFWQVIGCK